MVHPKQIRRIATNPAAYARFVTSGRLPSIRRPAGPLVELLRAIDPRDRIAIRGVMVDPRLGYKGSRTFHTAEQALRWVAPDEHVLESESWPAESWRDKRFAGPLYVEDLLACASSWPERLVERYPRLRRAAVPARLVDEAGTEDDPPTPSCGDRP